MANDLTVAIEKALRDNRNYIEIFTISVLASVILMLAEFGSFTFVSDVYHVQINHTFPREDFSANARFVPGLLFHTLFSGTYLPSLFLLLAITSVVFAGLLIADRVNLALGRTTVIPLLLLVFHPFLFPHYAYPANRLLISSAVVFGTLSALTLSGNRYKPTTRVGLSALLLSLGLMSYQPIIGAFLVCALFLHANAVFERNLAIKKTITYFVNIVLTIAMAFVIYKTAVFAVRHLGITTIRVDSMLSVPTTLPDLQQHIVNLLGMAKAVLFDSSQFFP